MVVEQNEMYCMTFSLKQIVSCQVLLASIRTVRPSSTSLRVGEDKDLVAFLLQIRQNLRLKVTE